MSQTIVGATHQNIPICKGMLGEYVDYAGIPGETGLAIQLFELRDVLVANRMVTFRASETCMYPCIRPGDILHVRTGCAEDMRIGDIAVFRRGRFLFSHRVVGKGLENGKWHIVTKPDRSMSGDDGPTTDEDLLGVVSGIERNGKLLPPSKPGTGANLFTKIFPFMYSKSRYLYRLLARAVAAMQEYKGYSHLARLLFPESKRKIGSLITVPLNLKTKRFHRKVSVAEFIALENVSKWQISFTVNEKNAAHFAFEYREKPYSGWWIDEMFVRIRFRGIGLEKRMFATIDELFRLLGATEIHISIQKGTKPEKTLAHNLGFRLTEAKEYGVCKNGNGYSVPIVILKRTIEKNFPAKKWHP